MALPSIVQMLVLRNESLAQELSAPLWSALKEVEAFYNAGEPRADFRRVNLSVVATGTAESEGALDTTRDLANLYEGEFWMTATGKFTRTVDYSKVSRLARTLADVDPSARHLIVIDRELTPPPEWRYIIFDGDSQGTVVSMAPTDPQYWRNPRDDRIEIIKHRVRTSCLNAVGMLLGLERCDNPSCLLYDNIDAVTALDGMVALGEEHGLPTLAGRGFSVNTTNPGDVQPIVLHPVPLES